jgi:hypothetical protein
MVTMKTDKDFEEHEIEKVEPYEYKEGKKGVISKGWEITYDGGWANVIDEKYGVVPKVGDNVKIYGRRGSSIRGVVINNKVVFYRTPKEDNAHHKQWCLDQDKEKKEEYENTKKKILDADYAKLPPIFQQRIDKFRKNNPDFRWKYEDYEMFVCKEAVKIATTLKTKDAVWEYWALSSWDDKTINKLKEKKKMNKKELDGYRKGLEKRIGLDDGHSGNTYGMACKLAYLWAAKPEFVVKHYGALAPLVGSEEYGCVPKKKPEKKKDVFAIDVDAYKAYKTLMGKEFKKKKLTVKERKRIEFLAKEIQKRINAKASGLQGDE